MNYCIIVARYNEDLQWIKPFVNTIVYNKGTALTEDFTQITLMLEITTVLPTGGFILHLENKD